MMTYHLECLFYWNQSPIEGTSHHNKREFSCVITTYRSSCLTKDDIFWVRIQCFSFVLNYQFHIPPTSVKGEEFGNKSLNHKMTLNIFQRLIMKNVDIRITKKTPSKTKQKVVRSFANVPSFPSDSIVL